MRPKLSTQRSPTRQGSFRVSLAKRCRAKRCAVSGRTTSGFGLTPWRSRADTTSFLREKLRPRGSKKRGAKLPRPRYTTSARQPSSAPGSMRLLSTKARSSAIALDASSTSSAAFDGGSTAPPASPASPAVEGDVVGPGRAAPAPFAWPAAPLLPPLGAASTSIAGLDGLARAGPAAASVAPASIPAFLRMVIWRTSMAGGPP